MEGRSLIDKHFPGLSARQQEQFDRLNALYREWNAKINVISRKDIDLLYLHHVLPSLAFAKVLHFTAGTGVIDVGTGGGFPGIPLAILMPEVSFTLIDSVAKKVKVVQHVAESLGLENVQAQQIFSKEHKGRYDFVIGRAVKPFGEFYSLTKHLVHRVDANLFPNGFLYLTGGEVSKELKQIKGYDLFPLEDLLEAGLVSDKKIIYYPA